MAYKVIRFFDDLQDNNHHYETGDEFPRPGLTVSVARIKELSSANNKQFRPLIEKVADIKKPSKASELPVEVVESESKGNVSDDNIDLATAKFFTLKSLAKKHGIDTEGKDSAALREELSKVM